MTGYPRQAVRAAAVFDIVDQLAAARGLAGPRPRPVGRVTITLAARRSPTGDRPWPGTPELLLRTGRDGFLLFFGAVRTPAGVRRPPLGDRYQLLVASALYQPAELPDVVLPQPDGAAPLTVGLLPGPSYPFPTATVPAATRTGRTVQPSPEPTGPTLLRGTVRDPDGRPVPGALVAASEGEARTAANGDWVLHLPGLPPDATTTTLTLTVTLPGRPPVPLGEVPVRRGATTVLPADLVTRRIADHSPPG